jgi:hypothetical protein
MAGDTLGGTALAVEVAAAASRRPSAKAAPRMPVGTAMML